MPRHVVKARSACITKSFVALQHEHFKQGKKHFHAAQKQVQRIATTPRSCVVRENTASEQARQKRDNQAKTEEEQ
jgi:hypothetical protein